MNWIALRMLMGDRAKYMGILLGVSFAALLMAQQSSTFCGLMLLTSSQIQDIRGAEIWVMDPNVQFIDDIKPMSTNDLFRVRGVSGVQWAVPLYKGLSRARLNTGLFQQVILIGLDDATLVGAPRTVTHGRIEDLRRPDAIIMDERGCQQLWPEDPFRLGRVFEMNDRRAILVGVCESRQTFQTFPIVYTRFSQAVRFIPAERKFLSFILAEPQPGLGVKEVCERIELQTRLKAESNDEFMWTTIDYYLRKTGIPINFGITVVLGFVVGTAIAGQTFYLFTIENLKQLGTLKAMGATNWQLVGMILLQALVVGLIGFSLGIGAASMFGLFAGGAQKVAFFMPWQVLVGTLGAVLMMMFVASLLSIRKVLVLDPAIVFRS